MTYINIYSTDDEIVEYAKSLGEAEEAVSALVSQHQMNTVEFAKALGLLLAKCQRVSTIVPARAEWLKEQRSMIRDLTNARQRDQQLARRDEPSRG